MKTSRILVLILALVALTISACQKHEDQSDAAHHKIVDTSPKVKDVTLTEQYVCQIHAQRHIKVCALANGYLEEIRVGEGQPPKPRQGKSWSTIAREVWGTDVLKERSYVWLLASRFFFLMGAGIALFAASRRHESLCSQDASSAFGSTQERKKCDEARGTAFA